MKKILFFWIFITTSLNAQVTERWVREYDYNNHEDEASCIAIDNENNIIISGKSESISSVTDISTVKYNSAGQQQWVARYSGAGNYNDEAIKIKTDQQGNIYIVGRSWGATSGVDYLTLKYDPFGNLMWAQKYVEQNSQIATDIEIDQNGNVFVTGYSSQTTVANYDFLTIKYNSLGELQWTKRYNGTENSHDGAEDMAIDMQGNIYVTGFCSDFHSFAYCTIKYSNDGAELWIKKYDGFAIDQSYAICLDNSSNVYITGRSYNIDTSEVFLTIKYNSDGIQQWSAMYHRMNNSLHLPSSILIDNNENVIVSGITESSINSMSDFVTVKYNSAGVQQWVSTYNFKSVFSLNKTIDAAIDSDGSIYVSGTIRVDGSYTDCMTIKYNAAGIQQWIKGSGINESNEESYGLVLDNYNDVIITGMIYRQGGSVNYLTIKYSQTIGIQSISHNIPASYYLNQNYPNPFNPKTNIEFSLPEKSFVKLKVFDFSGRQIDDLVNENLSVGSYKVDFDGSNNSSGVYFYTLETDKFIETKRMVLLK